MLPSSRDTADWCVISGPTGDQSLGYEECEFPMSQQKIQLMWYPNGKHCQTGSLHYPVFNLREVNRHSLQMNQKYVSTSEVKRVAMHSM